jgi:hypothetical protein
MTKVLSLSSDKDCRYLAGTFTRPLESREYAYSPMNVLFVKVMFLIKGEVTHNYPQSYLLMVKMSINIKNYYGINIRFPTEIFPVEKSGLFKGEIIE